MSWLDKAFFRGLVSVQTSGTALPAETTLNFTGAGVSVTDDPTNGRTNVTIAGATLPVNRPAVEKGANYTLVSTTDHLVTFTGAGPWTATLPAAPAAGDEYVIANESSSNLTVAGNGNAFLVAGSSTIAPGQAVTFIKSTSANWIAS